MFLVVLRLKYSLAKQLMRIAKECDTNVLSCCIVFIKVCFIPICITQGEYETTAFFASPLKIMTLPNFAEVFLSDEKEMGYFLQLPKD